MGLSKKLNSKACSSLPAGDDAYRPSESTPPALPSERSQARIYLNAGYHAAATHYHKPVPQHTIMAAQKGYNNLSDKYISDQRRAYKSSDYPDMFDIHFYRLGYALFSKDYPDFKARPLPEPEVMSPLNQNSAPLRESIEEARGRLSEGVKALLTMAKGGGTVKLARRLADYNPELASTEARGQNGLTLENTPAWFDAKTGEITLLQEFRLAYAENNFIRHDKPLHSFLHEAGHALDSSLPTYKLSGRDWFTAAYKKDLAHLASLPDGGNLSLRFSKAVLADTGEEITRAAPWGFSNTKEARSYNLRYFLTKDRGGLQETETAAREETFAELFSLHHGSTDASASDMKEIFHNSAQALDGWLRALGHVFLQELDLEKAYAGYSPHQKPGPHPY